MKYKRLPQAELEKLEKEFVHFLSANGITASDWQILQKDNTEMVEDLIAIFSDLVYQKVLEKIDYLEFRTKNDIKCFFCDKDQINLIGLSNGVYSTLDFSEAHNLENFRNELLVQAENVKIYKSHKKYSKSREEEIFGMMENGAVKTDDWFYKFLEKLYMANK